MQNDEPQKRTWVNDDVDTTQGHKCEYHPNVPATEMLDGEHLCEKCYRYLSYQDFLGSQE